MKDVAVTVEAAYTATVAEVMRGDAVTWTDICQYVHFASGIRSSLGRGGESESTTPGRCSFTTKTLHDGSTADLTVRMPVRIRVTAEGETYTLWTGSVSSVRQGWVAGVRGVQQVECSDMVAVTERIQLDGWAVEAARAIGDVVWLFPLDDSTVEFPPREASGLQSPPQFRMRPVGVPPENSQPQAQAGSMPGSPTESGSVGFRASAFGGWCLEAHGTNLPSIGSNDGALLSAFAYPEVSTSGVDRAVVGVPMDAAYGGFLTFGVGADGRAFVSWQVSSVSLSFREAGTSVLGLDRWHHLAVGVEYRFGSPDEFRLHLWVDGVEEFTTSWQALPPLGTLGTGVLRIGANVDNRFPWTGRIAAVSAHSTLPADAAIVALAAVRDGWPRESTEDRFERLADYFDLKPSGLFAGGHAGTMGRQSVKGKSLASALAECAAVEGTPWIADRAGSLYLFPRTSRQNVTTTVSLTAAQVDASSAVALSDRGMVNVLTVSNEGGFTTTLRDQASIDAYGVYTGSVSFVAGADGEAETYGASMLAERKEPRWLTDSLTVAMDIIAPLLADPDDLLNTSVGSVIEVTGLPSDAALTNPRFFVEGYEDDLTPDGWRRTFRVSLVPADTSVWVLGTSLLGVNTRLG